jgi:hypothetical protein
MDPITLGLIAAGTASALGGITQGIGSARAAKAMRLTPQQQRELDALRRRQAKGQLGLTAAEEAALRRKGEAAQQSISRELEGQTLQQMAAAPGSAVSGRDIFLREQAEQQALRTVEQQQQEAIMQADLAERQEERARIAALEGQAQEAEAKLQAARMQALSLGLAGAGQVAQTAVQMKHQTALQEAQIPQQTDTDLIRLYAPQPSGFTFGGLVPSEF